MKQNDIIRKKMFIRFLGTEMLKRVNSIQYGETLRKKCIFTFFFYVRYQNDKMHGKHSVFGNEMALPENCATYSGIQNEH